MSNHVPLRYVFKSYDSDIKKIIPILKSTDFINQILLCKWGNAGRGKWTDLSK